MRFRRNSARSAQMSQRSRNRIANIVAGRINRCQRRRIERAVLLAGPDVFDESDVVAEEILAEEDSEVSERVGVHANALDDDNAFVDEHCW
jgi:hypothetical protein